MDNNTWLLALAGALLGFLFGLALASWRAGRSARRLREEGEKRLDEARRQLKEREEEWRREMERQLEASAQAAQRTQHLLADERDRLQRERDRGLEENRSLLVEREQLGRELERLRTAYEAQERRMAERQVELEQSQARLRTDFENLANRIFEEKNRSFQEQSRKEMGEVVNPLRERLVEFQQVIAHARVQQEGQSVALKEQILQLTNLNQTMLQDARNLTHALKGDSKVQGNWGEMILERILERSGLERGREYEVQVSQTNEEGRRLQPDVVLHLPGSKNLIIDAKVSLTAYERYSQADDPEEQRNWLRAHVQSLRAHVKGLSQKNYPDLYQGSSPDFVLLFIPVEPAFSLAVREDDKLYMDAFDQRIVMVTPSTLLATLRTLKHIWNQDKQSKNVMEIASEAGKLHDQFSRLCEDLMEIGRQLEKTRSAYEQSLKRVSSGSGNLLKRVDRLRKLGAKAQRDIPEELRLAAYEEDEESSGSDQGESGSAAG